MKKIASALTVAVALLFTVTCSKVPITGRKQVKLIDESELQTLSLKSYKEFLGQHQAMPDSDPNTQMVKRVGKKIADAVTGWMNSHGYANRVAGYNWEFNLVNSKEINAWCMPGGKVVVYTGLLPVTQNETALAVVLGHEISHAIARHGNERMSQQLIIKVGAAGVGTAVGNGSQETQEVFNQAYNVGSALGALSYSRKHELEADKLGIVFMCLAGYDVNEAVTFWERMAKASTGSGGLFSTHPSDEKRVEEIRAFIPGKLKKFCKQPASS